MSSQRLSVVSTAILTLATARCNAVAQTTEVRIMPLSLEERALSTKFMGRESLSQNIELKKDQLESVLADNHPLLVVAAMASVAQWVTEGPGGAGAKEARIISVKPYIEQCLSSGEPFTRMAGALALCDLRQRDRLKSELETDSSFLLARPESALDFPGQSEGDEHAKQNLSVSIASVLGTSRDKLIEVTGDLKIKSARDNLEAIVADPRSDRFGRASSAARKALKAISSDEVPRSSVTSGAYRHELVPPREPEFTPRGTRFQAASQSIEPIGLAHREYCRQIRDAVGEDVDANEMLQVLRSAEDLQHPYISLVTADELTRWIRNRSVSATEHSNRTAIINDWRDQCLSSQAPFKRMAGVIILQGIPDIDRFRREISKDSTFLLIRPDPKLPASRPIDKQSRTELQNALQPVTSIESYRARVIKAISDYAIVDARGILEAIAVDRRNDEYGLSGVEARRAISKMDSAEGPGRE